MPSQIEFAKAPPSIIAACKDLQYQFAWILGQTSRPQGVYILLTGFFWNQPDTNIPMAPDLENDDGGGIYLQHPNGKCEALWAADNAFNNFFPDARGDKPTPQDAAIIHDLALAMIKRDERAFGGRQGLVNAIDATGTTDRQQDILMQPLVAKLRAAINP